MGFNRLKGLLYIVSSMNAFGQLNYFSIDWFHLNQNYISCFFMSRGANLSFSKPNRVIHLWEAFSLYNTQLELVVWKYWLILVDFGGILACEQLEEHMYGVLGTTTIRFRCSCASGWFSWCDFKSASVILVGCGSRFLCESKILCVLCSKV